MGNIVIKVEKATFSEINILTLTDVPFVSSLMPYWKGEEAELMNFLNEKGIELKKSFANSIDLINYANNAINKMNAIFSTQHIGKFDHRLASIIKPRFVREVLEADFMKMTFDLHGFDEDSKEKVINAFYEAKTRSIISFKDINDNEQKLVLYYNKKGIANDSGKLSFVSARDRITMLENYKISKDNNFICSGFLLEMARVLQDYSINDIDFSYSYVANNNLVEKSYSLQEVIKYGDMSAQEKEEAKRIENIKIQAQEEIKKENQEKRGSLPPESTRNEVLRASSSQAKFSIENEDLDTQLHNLVQNYKDRELEKAKLRLQEAERLSQTIYQDLKTCINDGMTIVESLNIINQKYGSNKDSVNLASFLLTKDLLQNTFKDKKIASLEEEKNEQEQQINNLSQKVSDREETIQEIKSELSERRKEIIYIKQEYDKTINTLKEQSKEQILNLKKEFDGVIHDFNSQIKNQQNLLDRYASESEFFKNHIEQISQEKNAMQEKNNDLHVEIGKYKTQLDVKDIENNKLQTKYEELLKKVSHLEKELHIAKARNKRNIKDIDENDNEQRVSDILK